MPPIAAVARKANARTCIFMALSSDWRRSFSCVDGGGESLLFAVVTGAFPEAWAADTGRAVPTDDRAVGVLADHVVQKDILGNDGVAFHAHYLGDVRDAA